MTEIEIKKAIKFLKPLNPHFEEKYNKIRGGGYPHSQAHAESFLNFELEYWKSDNGLPKHYAPEPID